MVEFTWEKLIRKRGRGSLFWPGRNRSPEELGRLPPVRNDGKWTDRWFHDGRGVLESARGVQSDCRMALK